MTTRARSISVLLAAVALAAAFAPTAAMAAKKPIVIGHRGASGSLPEHTLQAYRLAIKAGADYIEPDLVSTKDGVLVARHEPNIGGTTDVADHPEFASRKTTKTVDGQEINDWFASDFTLAELKTLGAKQSRGGRPTEFDGKFKIPTLQEVINLAKRMSRREGRKIGIYPETKHPTFHQDLGLALERPLVRALRRNNMNKRKSRVFIQSFEQANLKQLNTMTPVRLVQLVDAWDTTAEGDMVYAETSTRPYDWTRQTPPRNDTYGALVTDAGLAEVKTYADGIGPWKPHIIGTDPDGNIKKQTDLVRRAHQAGLVIHTWTFRDDAFPAGYLGGPISEYLTFYRARVDGLFTDFPETAVTAREIFWRKY